MAITIDDLRAAKWTGVMFLDGDGFYSNTYKCVTYPELSLNKSGPSGRPRKNGPQTHIRAFFIDGVEAPDGELQTACDMLNERRSAAP